MTPCTKSIKMIKTEKYHHFHQAQRVRMFLKVVQTFKYIYYIVINKYKNILFLLIPLSFLKPILKFLHTLFLHFIAHCIKEHVHCIWFLIYESSIAKSLKKVNIIPIENNSFRTTQGDYENVLKYLYTQSISSGFFWMFFCEFPDKNKIRFGIKKNCGSFSLPFPLLLFESN